MFPVVYFDQLSGAVRTRKLVKILFFALYIFTFLSSVLFRVALYLAILWQFWTILLD